jgi:hypothetical protein
MKRTPCVACTTDQACPRHTCGGCGRPDWECDGHFKEDRPESKLHVDGTLAAAQRAIELQAERDSLHNEIGRMEMTITDLRAKLAEHETLFAYATHRDDFLEQILAGIGPNLPPYTQRTVDGIVSAVANMALELDAHRDASTPAFDEIVKLCGLAKTWEYPGQVIRDVEDSLKRRDAKIEEIREERTKDLHVMTRQGEVIKELRTKLRVAEAVRDDAREASARDLELRRDALETADACREDQRALAKRRDELLATIARLSNTVPFPDEWKDWEGQRAKLVAEIGTLRSQVKFLSDDQVRLIEEREGHRRHNDEIRNALETARVLAADTHAETIRRQQAMLQRTQELTEQKDGAYRERDRCVAGIAALAVRAGWSAWLAKHPPDPSWDQDWVNIVFVELPSGQVSWHIHYTEVEWFSFLPWMPERKWDGHTTPEKYERLAGLSKIPPQHSRECGTRYRGCAPDCAFAAAQVVAPGGPTLGGEDLSPDPAIRRAQIEAVVMGDDPGVEYTTDLVCGCSLKYREMSPGVHAKYCSLAGQPLKLFVVEPAPGQCPWILDDEDPDEGYWHCAHDADHVGVHETAFGKGRDQRWKMRGNLLPGDTSKAIKPPRAP